MKVMKYKNYFGSINNEYGVLWGKLLLLDGDIITYEAEEDDYKTLRNEFKFAVEDYLLSCEEIEGKLAQSVIVEEVI